MALAGEPKPYILPSHYSTRPAPSHLSPPTWQVLADLVLAITSKASNHHKPQYIINYVHDPINVLKISDCKETQCPSSNSVRAICPNMQR